MLNFLLQYQFFFYGMFLSFLVFFIFRFCDFPRPPMEGIVLFFGKLGAGKTYGMVRECQFALRRGMIVYSNIPIAPLSVHGTFVLLPPEEILSLLRLYHEEPVVFALDEAWIMIDSYVGLKMELDMRIDLASLRKNNISLYMTSQRPSAVHKSCRELINFFFKCETMQQFGIRFFRLTPYDLTPSADIREEEDAPAQRFFFRPKLAESYDTYRSIRQMFDLSSSRIKSPARPPA